MAVKADIRRSGDRQLAIADLVAVAADIERTIFLPIARQARLPLKLLRVLRVFSSRLRKAFELFGYDLSLSLRGGSRRHSSIVTAVLMPEFRIKFFACQYRRLFKDSMSKQIDCAVAELARQ